ncbi:MAG TPA: mannosyltransferase family protein [Acidimicrobiales bacterium]|nr:mannosyltransferase family protein [Acidimicrobiales bacterium]
MTARRRHRLVVVGIGFVTTQLLTVVAWVLATAITRHQLGGDHRPPQYHGVLGWVSWDGGFYRFIAEHGYIASNAESIRFFPLYPVLGRILSVPLGGNIDLALFVIAKISVVVAAWGIHRLVVDEGNPEGAADRSVWFWLLFPGAFVLGWAYSEALLVALAVWGIWALRRQRWWLAAALGLGAGLCRPIGVALAAAAVVEIARHWPPRPARRLAAQAASVVAAPLGAVAFCVYSSVRGFGFWAPVVIQDELRKTETPLHRLWSLPETLTGQDAFTTGLHVPFVIGFLVLLVIVFWRLPATYGVFAAAVLAAALSAENLNSIERYATSAFPLAIAGALVLEGRDRFTPAVYAAGGALSVGLCALALTGAYVP